MPTKILQIDAAVPLEVQRIPDGYDRALVLIRWRGAPVGRSWLSAYDGSISAERLREAIIDAAGDAIALRQVHEYLRWTDADPPLSPARATVAVCTRDRPADLADCLDALCALPDEGQELLVVDSCSASEATRSVVARHARVRYVRENRPGLDIARNRALREATGDIVAFVDDDAIPEAGWLRALLTGFADARTLCVTGLTMPRELETPAQEWFERTNSFGRGFSRAVHDGAIGNPFKVARVGAGVNMALRRSVLELIGPFDEALDAGTPTCSGGDHDMFTRILAAGHRIVYEPGAIVWHRHRREWRELRHAIRGYGTGVYAYLTRHALAREAHAPLLALGWLRWQLTTLARALVRKPDAPPADLLLAELRGCAAGPRAYFRSRRAHPASNARTPPSSVPRPTTDSPAAAARLPNGGDDRPSISVVIPTHDRRDSVLRLVDALRACAYPRERLEVLVVADGCTDDTAAALRRTPAPFPLRVLEQHPGRGAAAARNLGAAHAAGDVLLFIDDDIEPLPTALDAHAAAHAAADDRVVIGAPIPIRTSERGFGELAMWSWWEQQFERMRRAGYRFVYSDVFTGTLSMRRALFTRVGGFDAALDCHEDSELGLRLFSCGARITFAREAGGIHHELRDGSRLRRRKEAEGRADVLLARRYPALWPVLRLAWGDAPVWAPMGLVRRVAFAVPGLGDAGASIAARALGALEWMHLRGAWRMLHGMLVSYWYWRGAAATLGRSTALRDLAIRGRAAAARQELRELDIDLLDGLDAIERRLDAERPDAITIRLGDFQVGRIPAVPGAEPLHGGHLRPLLATELARPLFHALLLHDSTRAQCEADSAPATAATAMNLALQS